MLKKNQIQKYKLSKDPTIAELAESCLYYLYLWEALESTTDLLCQPWDMKTDRRKGDRRNGQVYP